MRVRQSGGGFGKEIMSDYDNSSREEGSSRHVLFVDYDGVLHRLSAHRTRCGIVSSDPKTIRLFEYAPVLEAVIEPYPEIEIVLSTSWVPTLGFDRAKNALPVALRGRVAGATFHSKYHDAWAWPIIGRGVQILRYVRVHQLRYWVAIDDQCDGFDDHDEHLVKCDEKLALGDRKAVELLRCRLAAQFGPPQVEKIV
jgi:hypothetical protein